MKPFNVGIIGIGDISNVYINNLKKFDIVQITACAGRSLEKAENKAAEHNIEKAYSTAQQLIEDKEIDIVLNLTVPEAHAEWNIAALEAGKHVYTEKPLAAKLEDGEKIMKLARAKGLYVGSAPDTFLGGRLQTIRKLIDEGAIGKVIGTSAFFASHGHESFHPNPAFFYQKGGGPLLDVGPYYMTALLSLLGPVKSCSAMGQRTFAERTISSEPSRGSKIPVEVDTHITGNLLFESGAIGTVLMSFDVWDSELPRIELYGTKGTICINDIDPLDGPNLFGGPVLIKTMKDYRWGNMPRTKTESDWESVPVIKQFSETSHDQNSRGIGLIDMAYAIREGRKERASGDMALHSLEVLEGLLKSAKQQRFYHINSTFDLPEPLPMGFPKQKINKLE